MHDPALTPDTQAVLLLCGRFAPREPVQPLEPGEYNRVVDALRKRQLRPASLLDGSFDRNDWMAARIEPARAEQLLARRMSLGLATERWSNGGLWVISRSDDVYPLRLRQHLGRSAPPLMWGVGDLEIANSRGVAIVGSRDVDEAAAQWAEEIAARCAREDITVISGGARGVDQIAMAAALEAGGRVVAVLPEGLGKPAVVAKYRDAVLDGRLLLLSPFYPDAAFAIGNAMARNKLLYGLAEAAAIVRADANKGGTWSGAEEELRRENAIPLFVRATEPMADGNRALIGRGARPFPAAAPPDLRPLFFEQADGKPAALLPLHEVVMDKPTADEAEAGEGAVVEADAEPPTELHVESGAESDAEPQASSHASYMESDGESHARLNSEAHGGLKSQRASSGDSEARSNAESHIRSQALLHAESDEQSSAEPNAEPDSVPRAESGDDMTSGLRAQPRDIYGAILPFLLATFAEPLTIKAGAEKLDVKESQLKVWIDRAVEQHLVEKAKGRPVKFRATSPRTNVDDAAGADGKKQGPAAASAIAQASLFRPKRTG